MYGLALPALSNTLSFVLVMPHVSFRWIARLVPRGNPCKQAVLGLALLLAPGCGGNGGTRERLVEGTGYSFSAPADWILVRSGREVHLSKGIALVSVERF